MRDKRGTKGDERETKRDKRGTKGYERETKGNKMVDE
jgi:hypothetical protein